jgi:hypothetical protein
MMELPRFLGSFVLPLVTGGDLHVGEPLELETVLRWETELGDGEEVSAIDDARATAAAALVIRPPPMVFGPDELRLAAALYDALALAHPASEGFTKKRARNRLAETARRLATVDPPAGRTELLARHTLLHRIFSLHRVDTRVSWWTGHADFRGQVPPHRLLLWPGVRRVRQEHHEIPVASVLSGDARPALHALAAATPLTDALGLSAPHRPPFRWNGKQAILADPELCRTLIYRWLPDASEQPDQNDEPLAAAGRAARAFEEAWGKMPGPEARGVLAFFVHLMAIVALGEVELLDPDAPSPVVAASLRDPESGAALACALPNAAARVDGGFGQPPGLADEPRLLRRFRAHRQQIEKGLTPEKLRELALRLRSALRVIP